MSLLRVNCETPTLCCHVSIFAARIPENLYKFMRWLTSCPAFPFGQRCRSNCPTEHSVKRQDTREAHQSQEKAEVDVI